MASDRIVPVGSDAERGGPTTLLWSNFFYFRALGELGGAQLTRAKQLELRITEECDFYDDTTNESVSSGIAT